MSTSMLGERRSVAMMLSTVQERVERRRLAKGRRMRKKMIDGASNLRYLYSETDRLPILGRGSGGARKLYVACERTGLAFR